MSDRGKKEKSEKCEKREKIEVEKIAKNTATKRERAAVEKISKQNVLKKDNLENAQKFKKRKLSPYQKDKLQNEAFWDELVSKIDLDNIKSVLVRLWWCHTFLVMRYTFCGVF